MRIILPVSIALMTLFTFCRTGLCSEPILNKPIVNDVMLHVKSSVQPIGVEIIANTSISASETDKAKLATVTIYNATNGDPELRQAHTAFRFPNTDYQFYNTAPYVNLLGLNDSKHRLLVRANYANSGKYSFLTDSVNHYEWTVTSNPQNAFTFDIVGQGSCEPDSYQLTVESAAWTE